MVKYRPRHACFDCTLTDIISFETPELPDPRIRLVHVVSMESIVRYRSADG